MLFNTLNLKPSYDVAIDWKLGFQDPATPLMEGIINLHHSIFFFIVIIVIFVSILLLRLIDTFYFIPKLIAGHYKFKKYTFNFKLIKSFLKSSKFTHSSIIEIIWTIIPSFILILIAIPSFILLYSIDEIVEPEITLKAIGHQWYWSYELTDFNKYNKFGISNIVFDSFMIPEDELKLNEFRLLEVDRPLILPTRTHIRIIVGAADVLHSWAIPSLGIKIDAVPGRLNQSSMFIKRSGIYYGQCSEICGVNHGFMPIVIHAIPTTAFFDPSNYLTKCYSSLKN